MIQTTSNTAAWVIAGDFHRRSVKALTGPMAKKISMTSKHNFSFREDYLLEFSLPNYLNIARYDSISGEELSPYRRLSAGCIKTYIGGSSPYKALIHKNIPVRSIGIGIAPAYYEDYLKKLYPEAVLDPIAAFRKIDETTDFPEMSQLLTEIRDYRGEGLAAKLFYEGKVAEAVSLVVAFQLKYPDKQPRILSQQDIESVRTVAAYLNDHYAADIPLERLAQIACMGTTKLKSCFKNTIIAPSRNTFNSDA